MTRVSVSEDAMLPFVNGYYHNPWQEDGTLSAEAEAEYLQAYHALFNALKAVIPLVESGEPGEADIAMSQYVDATRVLVVVVREPSERLRAFVEVAFEFLATHPEHAVLLDDYPIQLLLLPSRTLWVPSSVPVEYLRMLGIEGYARA
ncbi:MAG TPA: hypothetical protein VGE39_14380 [Prosthecobacter sp.]